MGVVCGYNMCCVFHGCGNDVMFGSSGICAAIWSMCCLCCCVCMYRLSCLSCSHSSSSDSSIQSVPCGVLPDDGGVSSMAICLPWCVMYFRPSCSVSVSLVFDGVW